MLPARALLSGGQSVRRVRQCNTHSLSSVRQRRAAPRRRQAYKAACPESGSGRGTRGHFDFLRYEDQSISESGVQKQAINEEMAYARFFDWYTSPKGGKHPDEAAALEWQRLLHDPSVDKGRTSQGETTCVVHKKNVVIGFSGQRNTQAMVTGLKDVKNPKPLNIEAIRSSLGKNQAGHLPPLARWRRRPGSFLAPLPCVC